MTDRLAKAIRDFRDADHEGALSIADEKVREALQESDDQVRRQTIRTIRDLAGKCGNIEKLWESLDVWLEE